MTKKRHKVTKQYAKYLTDIFKLKRNCLLMKIFSIKLDLFLIHGLQIINLY